MKEEYRHLTSPTGTGPELAAVFEQVIQSLAAPYHCTVTLVRSPHVYHSYSSLLAINDTDAVIEETLTDAAHYRQFCKDAVASGVRAIFRTSISAQAPYLVREQLQAVKIEEFRPVTPHRSSWSATRRKDSIRAPT
jgi:hypothetical protein